MAEPVVIEARLRDELTAPIRTARTEVRGLAADAERLGRVSGGVASQGLSRMEERTRRLNRVLRDTHQAGLRFSSWLGSTLLTGARRGAIGIAALVAVVGGFGIKAASSFQQARLAFDTLLGSADKGKALFGQLQQLNLKTPFELGDIAPATQLLLRYGVAGDQVVGVLKSIMDAAALSGNPAENLQRISLAVGQVIQKGKLSGEEARQLAEAGIDAYGLMAVKLGKTRAEVIKLGAAGKLSSDVFVEGLVNMEGPLANLQGGAEKMSHTLLGQLSNLKDAVMVRLADAASPLVDVLTAQIPAITAAVGTAVDVLGPPIFQLIGMLATGLTQLLPIIAPLLATIVGQLGRLFAAAGPALAALEPLSGQLGSALVELVDALIPVLPDLVDLFVALVGVLPEFIRLLIDLVPIMDAFARLATTLLGYDSVRTVLAGLLVVMLGYRALSGIVTTLWTFAGALRAVAAAQTEANTAAAAGGGVAGGGRLGAGLAGLAGAGLWLGGMTHDQQSGPTVGGVLSGAAGGALVGGALGSVLPGVGTGIGAGVGALIGGGSTLLGGLFGDVTGNLAASSRVHALAAGRTPGRSPVTSSLRNFAVAGGGSGHLRGTAWDAHPDFPQSYANNIRALGGFAAVHDAGFGRHVHAQIGDSTPVPAGGGSWQGDGMPPIVVHIDQVVGQVDFERGVARGVARGIELKRRRDVERAHIDRTGAP